MPARRGAGPGTTGQTNGVTSATSGSDPPCRRSCVACWRRWWPRIPRWAAGSPTTSARSWFPDIDWSKWSATDKKAYRDGAIALTRTVRQVADEHGLIVIVNVIWTANDGGGYPDQTKAGNALIDGGFVEHHDGQIGFFGPYACSAQWASQSAVPRGKAFMYSVTDTSNGLAGISQVRLLFLSGQTDHGRLRIGTSTMGVVPRHRTSLTSPEVSRGVVGLDQPLFNGSACRRSVRNESAQASMSWSKTCLRSVFIRRALAFGSSVNARSMAAFIPLMS